tara:strand:- start:750 stop:1340 length:591 start_codon:yes stop_codon:yes gene_type:complete
MKKALSLLSTNHLNLLEDIDSVDKKFDTIHFDLTDNDYCETLGLSIITLEQLEKETTYLIDLHLLINNHEAVLDRIKNLKINSFTFHVESLTPIKFKDIKLEKQKKGIGILPFTDLEVLTPYLVYADFVLFLCISPSLSSGRDSIDPVERVKSFRQIFPDFKGYLVIDGGIDKKKIKELENLMVEKVVLSKYSLNN